MTGRTHLSAGIFTGELVVLSTPNISITAAMFTIFTAAIGSLLPDIDHPSSMLSTSNGAAKALSSSVTAVTKHRGFTHTIPFMLLVAIGFGYLLTGKIPYSSLLVFALSAGMLSHLVLDTLNEKGIMWLWPVVRTPIHIASIRTGSKQETFFRMVLNFSATITMGFCLYQIAWPYLSPYLSSLLQKVISAF